MHKRGKLDQAETAYRQMLEIDPSYAQAYLRIGMIYEEWAGRETEK
jgi:tetratricopeptide (TPR) repeat protein